MKFSLPSHGLMAGSLAGVCTAALAVAVLLGALGGPSRAPRVATARPLLSQAEDHRSREATGTPVPSPTSTASGRPNPSTAHPQVTAPGDAPVSAAPSSTSGPTSTPRPTSTPDPTTHDGVIHNDGHGHLTLNGARYQFVGVNAYELATWWGVNWGCGGQISDLDGFFSSLTPNSVVRFWAFQDFAQNKYTGGRDWAPLDRVVSAAERAHQRLVFVFADQWANCHGEQYKDAAFYSGGYRTAAPPGELEPYTAWVSDVVSRYRSSSAVGMWEPVNEGQGDCGAIGPAQLHAFFSSVGGLIKSIDRVHLVESGVLGGSQCGINNGDYITAQDTTNIDVVSYHDYADASPLPAELSLRLQQAQQLHKPLIVGEAGFLGECALMKVKQPAQFAAGVSGFMPWNWDGPGMSTCGF